MLWRLLLSAALIPQTQGWSYVKRSVFVYRQSSIMFLLRARMTLVNAVIAQTG